MSPPAPVRAEAGTLQPPAGSSLRRLLDMSSHLLCACDLQGRVLWWNRAAETFFGHELDTRSSPLAGGDRVDLASLVHPDDAAALASVLFGGSEAPCGSGGPASVGGSGGSGQAPADRVRARVADLDGNWRSVEWVARVDIARGVVYAAGSDLSESHAADQAARTGEARLRAIVEHAPSAMFVQDLDGRYLLANGEWARLIGREPGDVLGATDAELCLDDADLLGQLRAELVADGSAVTRDVSLHPPEGSRELLVTEFLLRDDSGEPYAVGGIATDITERKQVAAALGERERILETVLEASPDIISLLDSKGRVERISAAEQRILGHRHHDPADMAIFSLVHPDDFDDVASSFIRMVTGSTRQIHVRYRAKDVRGHWVTMDSRARAIVDEGGEFAGAVVVSRDITTRLEAEQRLQAVRQAAEQASRAKSDFLSRMSHELRTPLNSILGFAQLLEMDDLPLPQADAVGHILRGGRHLLDLIDEVLDIARIETGHLPLSIRPVLVGDVVAEAVDLLAPIAGRADVVVHLALAQADSSAVLADRQRLLQVLLNLLSNAVKYNRPGGHVDVSCQAAPSGRVRIAVADTGRGIRNEDMGRVFEPFDRLGAEQSGVEGTGVGLALARNLVEKMGGSMEVESVVDVGSTFVVDLPAAVVSDGAHRDERSAADRHHPPAFRVLLVEPDLGSLELVERVLSRRPGVVVMGAMHGRLALELAEEHRPDLILLDLHLPDMPGTTLLERLGEVPATAGIPVAVLSGDDPPTQVRRLLGRGVAGHVTRPVDVRALLSLVDAVRAASGR